MSRSLIPQTGIPQIGISKTGIPKTGRDVGGAAKKQAVWDGFWLA